jgi:hypothetical protein
VIQVARPIFDIERAMGYRNKPEKLLCYEKVVADFQRRVYFKVFRFNCREIPDLAFSVSPREKKE